VNVTNPTIISLYTDTGWEKDTILTNMVAVNNYYKYVYIPKNQWTIDDAYLDNKSDSFMNNMESPQSMMRQVWNSSGNLNRLQTYPMSSIIAINAPIYDYGITA